MMGFAKISKCSLLSKAWGMMTVFPSVNRGESNSEHSSKICLRNKKRLADLLDNC